MTKPELIELLRELHQKNKTGMLFITLSTGQNTMIGVENGVITAARMGREDGNLAIDRIVGTAIKRGQFVPGPVNLPANLQLSPEILARRLSGDRQRFSPEWAELIQMRLVEMMGPQGKLLCQEAFAHSPILLSDALEQLLPMIPDPQVAAKLAQAFPESLRQAASLTAAVGRVTQKPLPSTIAATSTKQDLPPKLKQDLLALLSDAVGPIAVILYDSALANYTGNKAKFISELCASIPDVPQQQAFSVAAHKLLN